MSKKNLFRLQIISPEHCLLNKEIEFCVLPTPDGQIGILANHAPALIKIVKGSLSYKYINQKENILAIENGLAEILPEKVTIFID